MPESKFVAVGLNGQQEVQQKPHLWHIAAVAVDVDQVPAQAGVHLRQADGSQVVICKWDVMPTHHGPHFIPADTITLRHTNT